MINCLDFKNNRINNQACVYRYRLYNIIYYSIIIIYYRYIDFEHVGVQRA